MGLATICFFALYCQPPPESPSLAQVQSALAALATSWHTRELEFVFLPRHALDGPADHPDRFQALLRQSQEGYFLIDGVKYRAGRPLKRVYFGFDGTNVTSVDFRSPLPDDPTQAEIEIVQIRADNNVAHLNYPHQLDLKLGGRRYDEWLQLPSASLNGRIEVDGADCIRAELTVPGGVHEPLQDTRVELALDPAIRRSICGPDASAFLIPPMERVRAAPFTSKISARSTAYGFPTTSRNWMSRSNWLWPTVYCE